MTDRTNKELAMKRTAIVLGVAAALTVPSVAPAASKPQAVVQVKPQLTAQVISSQVATAHMSRAQVARVAAVKRQIAKTYRVSALGTKVVLTRYRR
jgi:pyrroline-5-carboxylate reductase